MGCVQIVFSDCTPICPMRTGPQEADSGPYNIWLLDTTAISDTFVGQPGRSYTFYSLARDKVGNLEAAPVAPDATTKIPYLILLPAVLR
jgi:hypothetical protein